jgi:hypothetical protein
MLSIYESWMIEGNTLPVHIIRYNAHAFQVDGKSAKVLKKDREARLLEVINEAAETASSDQGLQVQYMFYDMVDGKPAIMQDEAFSIADCCLDSIIVYFTGHRLFVQFMCMFVHCIHPFLTLNYLVYDVWLYTVVIGIVHIHRRQRVVAQTVDCVTQHQSQVINLVRILHNAVVPCQILLRARPLTAKYLTTDLKVALAAHTATNEVVEPLCLRKEAADNTAFFRIVHILWDHSALSSQLIQTYCKHHSKLSNRSEMLESTKQNKAHYAASASPASTIILGTHYLSPVARA